MSKIIKIVDKSSNEILYEFPLESQKDACNMAATLEAMDIAVKVEIPSVLEQLASELGADMKVLNEDLKQEIEDHNT